MEPRVKRDRFTEDQQSELPWVKQEQAKNSGETSKKKKKKTMKGQLSAKSEW